MIAPNDRTSQRTGRARRTAVALVLCAVASGVSWAYAGQATAKTIGLTDVKVNDNDTNANAHWGEAWNQCRSQHAETRSVHYRYTTQTWRAGDPSNMWWVQKWICDGRP